MILKSKLDCNSSNGLRPYTVGQAMHCWTIHSWTSMWAWPPPRWCWLCLGMATLASWCLHLPLPELVQPACFVLFSEKLQPQEFPFSLPPCLSVTSTLCVLLITEMGPLTVHKLHYSRDVSSHCASLVPRTAFGPCMCSGRLHGMQTGSEHWQGGLGNVVSGWAAASQEHYHTAVRQQLSWLNLERLQPHRGEVCSWFCKGCHWTAGPWLPAPSAPRLAGTVLLMEVDSCSA